MKKKKLNKKIIITASAIAAIVIALIITGVISFSTMSQAKATTSSAFVDELTDGYYYIWHNSYTNDITNDLENGAYSDVFRLCPEGDKNWTKKRSYAEHTIWFTSDNDNTIPTFYQGDKLLYFSQTTVPEEIEWEHFADYGYTIGVANLKSDTGGHCYIENSDGKSFSAYVYSSSDANEVNMYNTLSKLYLDKVGNKSVTSDNITDGGTVSNLVKDAEYVCEFYTGTYYQDFALKASIHTFGTIETFTTYDYKFLHSNCIEITIPDWFKSGYYYVNGIGFFRYVSSIDETIYNKEPYDSAINWNETIKQYDSDGKLIYDPSEGVDKRNSASTASTTAAVTSKTTSAKTTSQSSVSSTKSSTGKDTSGINADVGLNNYETISNEIKVK